MLLPLLAAVLPAVVPSLIHAFAGDDEPTATAAQAAADAIAAVVGTDDPAEAREAVSASAEKRETLAVRLAEIAAQREAARDAARTAELQAVVADLADARATMVALTGRGSRLAWMPAIVTFLLLAGFAGGLWVVLTGTIPADNQRMADTLLGGLYTLVTASVTYWVGTSRGAVEMRQALQGARPGPLAGAGRG